MRSSTRALSIAASSCWFILARNCLPADGPSSASATWRARYRTRAGQIAVTGGAGESPLTARVASDAGARAIDLAGRTSLGALAALVARARLIVCNDTGLSHVAAAMRTPSVVIASGSDTRRWAPLDRARHCVLADWPACRPCAFRDCPYGHECAFNISVQAVLDAACAQLENIVLEETLHYAHD